jgi:hypothetical protein
MLASTVYTRSVNELVYLATFAGFAFWTCSFISTSVLELFRKGSNSLPTRSKFAWTYFSGLFISAIGLGGAAWLLVEV